MIASPNIIVFGFYWIADATTAIFFRSGSKTIRLGEPPMSSIYRASTIAKLIAEGRDNAPAIGAPERTALTHQGLRQLAQRTISDLNRMGIGRNDRVAIVLPNGPEMATAFIAIACGATTAPLNPAYRTEEFDFYLSDLGAKALVIQEGMDSPALAVAAARNIPLLRLKPGTVAGDFTLSGADAPAPAARRGFAEEGDIALVLHTSGTTSRPKIVPLSHTNVTASAYHIGQSLALTPEDVCLNIMPLFHIHGLIAATLSSIAAGASVVCTPGFNALKFFGWFEEANPTWYTAVPTMHQAILTRAERNREIITKGRLRFIRSSSSSLPPQVMEALEATFHVPVIEAYGMTEASHQMASNPLPPRERFSGCVGIAAGPDVAIMDEEGGLLPSGALGEIVIRGRNVTQGYEANPDANAKAFTNGWFRTGDQGIIDEAGYLRLTGRLKELINRGGEKISPLEVDTIIMDHPAVAQVVTFAVPHDKLGEDVAAAVVLREGAVCDERELRDFVSARVADFKVPRKIIFLTEIPKGATGKLQRIGLAEKLGMTV
jgi:acyl-CoA synthetase (AMP-forming)/AMP-acid ligase II